MFTEPKGCAPTADTSPRLLCLNVHLGFDQRRHTGIVFYPNILDWSPLFTANYSWVNLHVFCLFRPHTWVLSPTGLHLLTNVVLKSFPPGELNQWEAEKTQWRYAIVSHESKYWAALFPLKVFFFFFLSVCPDIFVLKVTKLWVWARCCVYVAYIAGRD